MERSDEPAKRPFLRRTIVGAGWAFLLWIGLSLVVAGWFWNGFSGRVDPLLRRALWWSMISRSIRRAFGSDG